MKAKSLLSLMIIFILLAIDGGASSEFNGVVIINQITTTKDIIPANIVGEETTQYQAVIGKPVKWIKNIRLDNLSETILLELPEEAKNVSVNKIIRGKREKIPSDKIRFNKSGENFPNTQPNLITGGVVGVGQKNEGGLPAKFFNWFLGLFMKKNSITGAVIGIAADEDNLTENITVIENTTESAIEANLTKQIGDDNVTLQMIEDIIQDNITELEVEYYTEAPTISNEENINRGKIVTVTSSIHYENVLIFTDISEDLNIKNPSRVGIKWMENNSFIPIQEIRDRDNNGIYDYIEWIAPHLSNQTFEIIIIAAEHLDEDRIFIEDIYDYVNETDNITYTIPEGEYVRAYFITNLTNENVIDVAVYNSQNSVIEIYEKDSDVIIGLIEIENDGIYATQLNHTGRQDVFDLKSTNGDVEYDYIHDARTLTSTSMTPSATTMNEGDQITATGIYNAVGSGGVGSWVFGITEINSGTNINATCGAGNVFQVISTDTSSCTVAGGETCSADSNGVVTASLKSTGHTVIWTIKACSGSSNLSPEDVITYKVSGNAVSFTHSTGNITINAAGTCTAPGSGNWAITCSDNCIWNTDFTVPANITITGSGTLTWNANMTMKAANWKIFKGDGCKMVVNPRGSIG